MTVVSYLILYIVYCIKFVFYHQTCRSDWWMSDWTLIANAGLLCNPAHWLRHLNPVSPHQRLVKQLLVVSSTFCTILSLDTVTLEIHINKIPIYPVVIPFNPTTSQLLD